jgi:hypothetical protein
VVRNYEARHGTRDLRVCGGCGRAEVTLPAERPREHLPAHALHRAAA